MYSPYLAHQLVPRRCLRLSRFLASYPKSFPPYSPADFPLQADDELDLPILAGFEWDPEECYTRFVVHQKKEGAAAPSKKKKKGDE